MAKQSKAEQADGLATALGESIREGLNKKFKNTNYKVAYFLNGDTDSPSEVGGWVSSG